MINSISSDKIKREEFLLLFSRTLFSLPGTFSIVHESSTETDETLVYLHVRGDGVEFYIRNSNLIKALRKSDIRFAETYYKDDELHGVNFWYKDGKPVK